MHPRRAHLSALAKLSLSANSIEDNKVAKGKWAHDFRMNPAGRLTWQHFLKHPSKL
jgi:hypothetical protein